MAMYLDEREVEQAYGYVALEELLHTAALLALAIVGFGLVSAYAHHLAWSAVGFNLLIAALSVQLYFFAQLFWAKALQRGRSFKTYEDSPISYAPFDADFGSMNEAVKCALAVVVAFSSLLGRAGVLEAYLLAMGGTVVYELSRQVLLKVTDCEVGSAKIFLFGGALGTLCSLMLRRTEASTRDHPNNVTSTRASTTALLGLLLTWVLFPLLARDETCHSDLQTADLRFVNIALSLAGSTALGAGVAFSDFGFRGFIVCSLAGGIAGLSSAPFITNPAYAIAFGFGAAVC